MSLNKHDRAEIEKKAKEDGYRWNSEGSAMINDNGKQIKYSESGGSVNVNGNNYNTSHDAKKSKGW